MSRHDRDFEPDTVNDRIKFLLRTLHWRHKKDFSDAWLVNELRQTYSEDNEILHNAWQRIAEQAQLSGAQKEFPESSGEEAPPVLPLPTYVKNQSGRTRLQRLGKISATLVASLLVAAILTVFAMARQGSHGTSSYATQQVRIQEAQTQLRTPSGLYLGDGTHVDRVDSKTGAMYWSYDLHNPNALNSNAITVANDSVYVETSDGLLIAINASDGTMRWTHNFHQQQQATYTQSKPITVGNVLYVASPGATRTINAFNATTGALLKTYDIAAEDYTIVDNVLYTTFRSTLNAYQLPDGAQLWQQPIGINLILSIPHVANGTVYFSSTDHQTSYIFAYDASTGRQRWQSSPITDGQVYDIAVDENAIYCGALKGNVYALDRASGRTSWSSDGIHFSGTSIQFDNDRLYVGFNDTAIPPSQAVYSLGVAGLDITTGHRIWQYSGTVPQTNLFYYQNFHGGPYVSSATIQNGIVYFANTSGDTSTIGGLTVLQTSNQTVIWHRSFGANTLDGNAVVIP